MPLPPFLKRYLHRHRLTVQGIERLDQIRDELSDLQIPVTDDLIVDAAVRTVRPRHVRQILARDLADAARFNDRGRS